MRILFVCLGNICRSPLAEAVFKEKSGKMNLLHVEADSCGTSNYNIGDDPDPRTMRSARKSGVPMSHHARQLTRSDVTNFDLILAMDHNNLRDIRKLCEPADYEKIKLFRDYDPLGGGDVPDPYYGAEKDFDEVFNIIDRTMDNLVRSLVV